MELGEFQNAVGNGKKIYIYHKLKPFEQQNNVTDKGYVREELCYKNKPIAIARNKFKRLFESRCISKYILFPKSTRNRQGCHFKLCNRRYRTYNKYWRRKNTNSLC